MLAEADLDAVVIATPSSAYAPMVRAAFDKGLHVFCEKPLTLSPEDSDDLTVLARERGLVTQVGYHNRFVGAVREVRALLDTGAIGEVTHNFGEAYGPVVLKPKGGTRRSNAPEGGGCLYDYAAHVINLINWYCGEPTGVGGTVLPKVFSADTEDAAFSTLYFDGGKTGHVRRHRGQRTGDARTRVPGDRDVGLRLRGDPADRGGYRVGPQSAEPFAIVLVASSSRSIRATRELGDQYSLT
jgi:predicted dehydrogenase